jgi:hypothetical protein
MRLEEGDRFWITPRDSVSADDPDVFVMRSGPLWVRWTGSVFLGCWWQDQQWEFRPEHLVRQLDPGHRCNIQCMVEQLFMEGAFDAD